MTAIDTAMVLAAGLGTRMRAFSEMLPKPLVPLAGRPLLDHVLDRLIAARVTCAVVNVHHRADLIEAHLAERTHPRIVISDERADLLETGGGIVKALPLLGEHPFLVHNCDAVWSEPPDGPTNLRRLIAAWDDTRMDGLLLLAPTATGLGYGGAGDFDVDEAGRLIRRGVRPSVPYVFTGVSIAHPRLFAHAPSGKHSLNIEWDRAIGRGRLFGVVAGGTFMHVGTPEALADAERRILTGPGR